MILEGVGMSSICFLFTLKLNGDQDNPGRPFKCELEHVSEHQAFTGNSLVHAKYLYVNYV